MRRFFRSQLDLRAPKIANFIHTIQNRRLSRGRYYKMEKDVRHRLFPDRAPISVRTGPFEGMRYFHETCWGPITPKWLGSYEAELQPVIDQIVARKYAQVVDVGCAEGYYAVGLAIHLPEARVYAFDADFLSRRQLLRLARLNGVENRVKIGSFCDHEKLESLCGLQTLVISDIEGSEAELLDTEKCPGLLSSHVLVEVHDDPLGNPELENLLISRFSSTHRIDRICATSREAWLGQYGRVFSVLSPAALALAVDESRAIGNVWLWMTPFRSSER